MLNSLFLHKGGKKMARPRSKNKVVCENKDCQFYHKEKGKDIIKRGKNKAKHERFYCFHCNKYFVETKGTPLYRRKLSERKIKEICREFVETKGIRATGRTVHVHRDTVMSIINGMAEHAFNITNYLVKDLGLKTYEVDELWTFLKKSRRGLNSKTMNSLDKARQLLQQL